MQFLKSKEFPARIAALFLLLIVVLQLSPVLLQAQNLGGAPATNKAVQGQTAAQPEGAFLNVVNWVGNVICPVGAALCVVMAIINYTHGRGVARRSCRLADGFRIDAAARILDSAGPGGSPVAPRSMVFGDES